MELRIHAFEPNSQASGPGNRAVLWVQGCDQNCPGCYSWEMSDPQAGDLMSVDDLFLGITSMGASIEGISISGGEPLQQMKPLLALLKRVRRETDLSVVLFTGYTWKEVHAMPEAETLLAQVDVLVAGPYDEGQHLNDPLRSSANQTIHPITERYAVDEL